ncbi:MAG: universal stress protein [Pseudomonadota bacterium]
MKTLLVPIEDHDGAGAVLAAARTFAAAHDAKIDAVGMRLVPYQAVGAEPIVAVSLPAADENVTEIARRIRERFEQAATGAQGNSDRIRWRGGDPLEDADVAELARVYDMTIIGRPVSSGEGPRMSSLETILFDSGRPILIVPPGPPPPHIGRHVVISWNRSTEAAETMTAAMPLVKAAEQVTILTVAGGTVSGPDAAALKDYLAVHGVEARDVTDDQGTRAKPGAAILDFCKREGADLLIKSAYTQSRLRQMVFGGATSTIISNTHLPVFMAN